MKFSIVIPLFNEAENILKLNSEIIQALSDLKNTNNENILKAFYFNGLYLIISIVSFYYSYSKARKKGTLINIGE